MTETSAIAAFWRQACATASGLPGALPEAWGFSARPAHANELLAFVLAGVKVGTAPSLWDYEESGDPLPGVGS